MGFLSFYNGIPTLYQKCHFYPIGIPKLYYATHLFYPRFVCTIILDLFALAERSLWFYHPFSMCWYGILWVTPCCSYSMLSHSVLVIYSQDWLWFLLKLIHLLSPIKSLFQPILTLCSFQHPTPLFSEVDFYLPPPYSSRHLCVIPMLLFFSYPQNDLHSCIMRYFLNMCLIFRYYLTWRNFYGLPKIFLLYTCCILMVYLAISFSNATFSNAIDMFFSQGLKKIGLDNVWPDFLFHKCILTFIFLFFRIFPLSIYSWPYFKNVYNHDYT